MPTLPADGDHSGCRILFGNLVKDGLKRLLEEGADKRQVAQVEELLLDLEEDDSFWPFMAASLLVYVTPEHIWTFRLPHELEASVTTGDRFFLKPLLGGTAFDGSAFLLALAVNSVRLFELLPDKLVEVKVADLPKSAADAARVGSLAVSTQSRRSDGSAAQRARLAGYCRQVDRALREIFAGRDVTLFLAADVTIDAIYRQVNSYAHLSALGTGESPENLTVAELFPAARTLLASAKQKALEELLALAETRKATQRSTGSLEEIARAATLGAVDTFIVDLEASYFGEIDESTGAVLPAAEGEKSTKSLTDEIARRTLANGGDVVVVRAADLPADGSMLALLRYAIQ